MPSASVSAATSAKAGERRSCRTRELHIVARARRAIGVRRISRSLFLPRSMHVRLSVARSPSRPWPAIARADRIHAALDELARAHLEVEGDLLVHFLVERHAPEPRAKGALHRANSTLRHAGGEPPPGGQFGGQLRAAGLGEAYSLARRPSSDVPHSASIQPRRSMR